VRRIRQSVSWWCFVPGLMAPEAFVRAAARIGYAGIDLVEPLYWQLVRNHGLEIAAVTGHTSLTDGLNRRENRVRIEAELTEHIAEAEKWRIPNLICFSGNRNGIDDREGAEITAENLRSVAARAESAGVTLVLELLNSKIDHPDYQCDHTSWGIGICRMVDSPSVKLLYDIYHMQIMEGDVIRTIREHHRYFGHYHTAGNPGRHDLDDEQELNYRPIVRAILESGYEGFLGQEFIPKGPPEEALSAAFQTCRAGSSA
jgi:hydroxypyruvate isomerase